VVIKYSIFTDTMDALAQKVAGDGSYNLEAVLKPMKDQISTAIMGYQNNSNETFMRVGYKLAALLSFVFGQLSWQVSK